MSAKEYRTDIDGIKGIAIIAVILYHVGMLPYGFLGVDAFLVINGFLIIPAIIKQFQTGQFHFFSWLSKRIFRLWPIVIAASIVCIAAGFWLMIPDSYENLAESVVASNVFANNILAAITTKNYWDVSNEFKPLMQMWYLGVVVQFYVIYPLILLLCKRCFCKHSQKDSFWSIVVGLIGIISLLLYIFFPDSFSNKFYFVQYRIWEFSIGGFIGLLIAKRKPLKSSIAYISYALLIILFIIGVQNITQVDTMTIIGEEINPSTDNVKMAVTLLTAVITGIALLTNVKWGGYFHSSEKCLSVCLCGIK
ncbi:MAG: acyltransferase [Muribaculum sp.]|nr:acyltransferase [Muribaculum sp.]